MLRKPGRRAHLPERVLHRHRIRAHHAPRVDGEDVDVVVRLDEVRPRHDLARQMQRHLRQAGAVLGIVRRGQGDEVRREHQRGGAVFLLVHHVVVHLRAEHPALVKEPARLARADLRARDEHVGGFGDAVQEGEAAADVAVHLVQNLQGGLFAEVAGAVVAEGGEGVWFGQVRYREHLHSGGEAFEALVHPIVVAVEDDGHEVAGGPLLGALLDELEQVASIVVVAEEVRAVDDEHERATDGSPAIQSHFLKLVESTLDV